MALSGAAVGLLVTRIPLEEALSKIEWPTLFFFVALFVMVGALEATGAIDEVADGGQGRDRRRPHRGAARDPLDRAIGSAVVDNIPFTTAMIPVVRSCSDGSDRRRLLVGALARRLLRRQRDDHRRRGERRRGRADRARRAPDRVRHLPARIGIPVTVISIVLASVYVGLRYVVL